MTHFLHAGTCQVVRLPRHHGEAETPMSNQSPRGAQGRRLLGLMALHTGPFASLLSHARHALCSGATIGVLGTGVPRLACLRPAVWLKWGPSASHLHQLKLKTLARGQALRGGRQKASSEAASTGRLARRRRDQGGVPHDVPVTQAMTTKGARRAPARAVSPFPLWCKGSKRRQEHQADRKSVV